jgi:hypothetical protein
MLAVVSAENDYANPLATKLAKDGGFKDAKTWTKSLGNTISTPRTIHSRLQHALQPLSY